MLQMPMFVLESLKEKKEKSCEYEKKYGAFVSCFDFEVSSSWLSFNGGGCAQWNETKLEFSGMIVAVIAQPIVIKTKVSLLPSSNDAFSSFLHQPTFVVGLLGNIFFRKINGALRVFSR
jgi:hypothetical protein